MANWSVPIERFAQAAGIELETVARKVTFELMRSVVIKSPVDTGRFKSNWNFSVGAPDYATTESTNAARADAEALRALTAPIGGVTYLSNGLPYGRRLENGWSKQAPRGMVRTSLASVSAFVRRSIKGAAS